MPPPPRYQLLSGNDILNQGKTMSLRGACDVAISRGNVGFSGWGDEWYKPCTVAFGFVVIDTLYQEIPTSQAPRNDIFFTFFDGTLHMCGRDVPAGARHPPYGPYRYVVPAGRGTRPLRSMGRDVHPILYLISRLSYLISSLTIHCPLGKSGGLPHQSADWFAMTCRRGDCTTGIPFGHHTSVRTGSQ